MTQLHADRLATLAAFLEAFPGDDPTREFDLAEWSKEIYDCDEQACGTAACACGWAATIPEFAAAGFVINGHYGWPEFQGRMAYGAAASFFGLSDFDSEYLFSPSRYRNGDDPSAAGVAERIRDFLTNCQPAA